MQNKTIIIFTATPIWSLNNKSGAPSCFNTIQGYADRGWKTILVSANSVDENIFKNVKVITPIDKIYKSTISANSNRISKFCSNIINSKSIENYLFTEGECILEKLDKKKLIIYAYEVHAVRACKRLSMKYNTPLITRFQGTIMYNKRNTFLTRVGYYPHYQALRTVSDLVIMTNDGTFGDRYLEKIGNKSDLMFLRNGVDIDLKADSIETKSIIKKKMGFEEDEIVLMTLSRLVNWKRVDRSIKVLSEVLKVRNRCRLVVIGDGDLQSELKEYAKKLGVYDSVVFLGAIPQENVANYLQISDIFLSLYDLGNAGNPTFEAMKCACTIIALDNGNTKEVLENDKTAILVDPNKIDSIPSIVIDLINDDDKRKNIGLNAQKYANEKFYTWSKRLDMECDYVEKLLACK